MSIFSEKTTYFINFLKKNSKEIIGFITAGLGLTGIFSTIYPPIIPLNPKMGCQSRLEQSFIYDQNEIQLETEDIDVSISNSSEIKKDVRLISENENRRSRFIKANQYVREMLNKQKECELELQELLKFDTSNSSSISIERVVDTPRGGFKPDPNQGKKIVYRIEEDAGLVRAAEKACKNVNVQTDVKQLEEELAKGSKDPGIGRKRICKGVIEYRAKNGGRLYVRESDDVIEILAKSGKKKSNQNFVIKRLKEIYD